MLEPKPDPMIARDLVGYGEFPPNPAWPGGALIAVNFNLNVEGGGEASLFNGDRRVGGHAQRHRRVGLYRPARAAGRIGVRIRQPPRRLARARHLPRLFGRWSAFSASRARSSKIPRWREAFVERGHEIVSHGYRWIDYVDVPEDVERQHIRRAIELFKTLTGAQPEGWMTGRPGPNTRRLIVEAGFLYDRDSLADELPYWLDVGGQSPPGHSRIRTKPTTTASTRTAAFRPGMSSSPTCATRSMCSIARARKALPSFSPSACMTG